MPHANLSRRTVLAGASAVPLLTLPGITAAAPDPVFAAIEKHRVAFAVFIARCRYEDDLAERGQELTPAQNDLRTPEMIALVNASRAARAELANTAPTTRAGMAAYLEFVLSESEKFEALIFEQGGEEMDFIRSLAHAAKRVAREETTCSGPPDANGIGVCS